MLLRTVEHCCIYMHTRTCVCGTLVDLCAAYVQFKTLIFEPPPPPARFLSVYFFCARVPRGPCAMETALASIEALELELRHVRRLRARLEAKSKAALAARPESAPTSLGGICSKICGLGAQLTEEKLQNPTYESIHPVYQHIVKVFLQPSYDFCDNNEFYFVRDLKKVVADAGYQGFRIKDLVEPDCKRTTAILQALLRCNAVREARGTSDKQCPGGKVLDPDHQTIVHVHPLPNHCTNELLKLHFEVQHQAPVEWADVSVEAGQRQGHVRLWNPRDADRLISVRQIRLGDCLATVERAVDGPGPRARSLPPDLRQYADDLMELSPAELHLKGRREYNHTFAPDARVPDMIAWFVRAFDAEKRHRPPTPQGPHSEPNTALHSEGHHVEGWIGARPSAAPQVHEGYGSAQSHARPTHGEEHPQRSDVAAEQVVEDPVVYGDPDGGFSGHQKACHDRPPPSSSCREDAQVCGHEALQGLGQPQHCPSQAATAAWPPQSAPSAAAAFAFPPPPPLPFVPLIPPFWCPIPFLPPPFPGAPPAVAPASPAMERADPDAGPHPHPGVDHLNRNHLDRGAPHSPDRSSKPKRPPGAWTFRPPDPDSSSTRNPPPGRGPSPPPYRPPSPDHRSQPDRPRGPDPMRQPGSGVARSDLSPADRALQGRITRAADADLLRVVLSQSAQFNQHHVANAFGRVARLPVSYTQTPVYSECVGLLSGKVWDYLHDGSLTTRQVCGILWALAKAGFRREEALVAAMLDAVPHHIAALTATGVARLLWSVAKVGCRDSGGLPRAVAARIADCESEFNPQEVANVLWALAAMGFDRDFPGARAAVQPVLRGCVGFNRLDTVNTLTALAKLGWCKGDEVVQLVMEQVPAQCAEFNSQDTANTLWALARMGWRRADADGLVAALVGAVSRCRARFNAQEAANVLWAVARMGWRPADGVVQEMLDPIHRLCRHFTPQGAAMILWALATMGWRHDSALAREIFGLLRRPGAALNAQDVANTVWALGRMGFGRGDAGVAELIGPIRGQCGAFSAQQVSNVLWALAVMGWRGVDGTVAALAAAAAARRAELAPQGVALAVWALARIGWRKEDGLVEEVAGVVRGLWGELNDQDVAHLRWGLRRMGFDTGEGLEGLLRPGDGGALVAVDAASDGSREDWAPDDWAPDGHGVREGVRRGGGRGGGCETQEHGHGQGQGHGHGQGQGRGWDGCRQGRKCRNESGGGHCGGSERGGARERDDGEWDDARWGDGEETRGRQPCTGEGSRHPRAPQDRGRGEARERGPGRRREGERTRAVRERADVGHAGHSGRDGRSAKVRRVGDRAGLREGRPGGTDRHRSLTFSPRRSPYRSPRHTR